MISLPEGWRRVASAGSDVYVTPDRRCQVRYHARLTPIRRVAAVVDDALAGVPEWRTQSVAPRERIVTHEGEYAFAIAIAGTWLGDDARRYLGVIYGDDTYDVLDAIALDGESFDTPRALSFTAQRCASACAGGAISTRGRPAGTAMPPG